MNQKLQKGMTIIELLIVVVLVAIVAIFAIPAYGNHTNRMGLSEVVELSLSMQTDISTYYYEVGDWPDSTTLKEFPQGFHHEMMPYPDSKATYEVTPGQNKVVINIPLDAEYGETTTPALQVIGTVAVGDAKTGLIDWVCEAEGVKEQIIPRVCR